MENCKNPRQTGSPSRAYAYSPQFMAFLSPQADTQNVAAAELLESPPGALRVCAAASRSPTSRCTAPTWHGRERRRARRSPRSWGAPSPAPRRTERVHETGPSNVPPASRWAGSALPNRIRAAGRTDSRSSRRLLLLGHFERANEGALCLCTFERSCTPRSRAEERRVNGHGQCEFRSRSC